MFSHDLRLTPTELIALSRLVVGEDEARVAPLIRLIQALTGRTDDLDRNRDRTLVLQDLYLRTEQFREHYRKDLGEGLEDEAADELVETNSAIAS